MQCLPIMVLHPSANNFQEFPSGFYKKRFGLSTKPSGKFVENETGKDAKSLGGNLKGAALKVKDRLCTGESPSMKAC